MPCLRCRAQFLDTSSIACCASFVSPSRSDSTGDLPRLNHRRQTGKTEFPRSKHAGRTQDHHQHQDQGVDDLAEFIRKVNLILDGLEQFRQQGQRDSGQRRARDASRAAQHDHDHIVHGQE